MDTQASTLPTRVEFGPALSGITSDPEWLKKYAMAGLFFLIPIAGPLAVLGWQRRIFEEARQGQTQMLPDLDFGNDISHGIPVLVAMLNLMVPMFVLIFGLMIVMAVFGAVGAGIDSATDNSGVGSLFTTLGMLGSYAIMMLAIMLMNLAVPEIQRRGFNGEMTPLLSPMISVRAIMANPSAYLMVIIGLFIANMIGSIGVFACYVGMFLTLPMAMVMVTRLLAQWDAVVEQSQFGG